MMLTEAERDTARRELTANHEALVSCLEAVPDIEWAAASDGWSPAQVLEHLILVESGALAAIRIAPASSETSVGRDSLVGLARRRSRRVEAPEFVQPSGAVIPRQELMRRFEEARHDSLAWLDDSGVNHRDHAQPHPFFGLLDGYQWLLFFAAHGDRHLAQLKERTAALPAG